MNSTNVAHLNERLLSKPEPLREDLARYIAEHLDEIEEEMHWADDPNYLSAELKAELDSRLEAFERDPDAGVTWRELNERLAKSR
jgi:putative addiction module component (TIGR02574 family)